jgi:putative membrane protein
VAFPPPEAAAKYPTSISPAQLHRYKVDVLRLALAFVISVKHYLREEDGFDYPDYRDVLPASFFRFDETGYNTLQNTGPSTLYDATMMNRSQNPSVAPSARGSPEPADSITSKPDATKRVKPKRSKQKIIEPTINTPLLPGSHRSVDFLSHAVDPSIPLPLV